MERVLERTLAIVKPDAIEHVDKITGEIEDAGFVIISHMRILMSKALAELFYIEHATRPFYEPLTKFMSSGDVEVMILSAPDAIVKWRKLMGPTDSNKARAEDPHTIRARYGTDNQRNACHGSDSKKSAEREIRFFFPWATVDPIPSTPQILNFLEGAVYPVLTEGLVQLCTAKPQNPTEWLGTWLLNNNPLRAVVVPGPAQEEPASAPPTGNPSKQAMAGV